MEVKIFPYFKIVPLSDEGRGSMAIACDEIYRSEIM